MKYITILLILLFPLLGMSQNEEKQAEKYFSVFLNKQGEELVNIFSIHQPTLADCKVMFKDEFYKEIYKNFNNLFLELPEQSDILTSRLKNKTICKATKFNSSDTSGCPGIVKRMSNTFTPNIECYRLEFLESKNSEFGSSFYFVSFINNRWVYFPIN